MELERERLKETLIAEQADGEDLQQWQANEITDGDQSTLTGDSVESGRKEDLAQSAEREMKDNLAQSAEREMEDNLAQSGKNGMKENSTNPYENAPTRSFVVPRGSGRQFGRQIAPWLILTVTVGVIALFWSWYTNLPRNPEGKYVPIRAAGAAMIGCVGETDIAYCILGIPSYQESKATEIENAIIKRFIKESGSGTKPLSATALVLRLEKEGEFSEANKELDAALESHPRAIPLRILKGYTLGRQGDFNGALKQIDEIEKIGGNKGRSTYSTPVSILKAKLLLAMGDSKGAFLETERAQSRSSDPDEFTGTRVRNMLALPDPDRAISISQTSLQRLFENKRQYTADKELRVRSALALSYLSNNDLAHAFEQAKEASSVEAKAPECSPVSDYLLSRIYCKSGDLQKALLHANLAAKASTSMSVKEQRAFVLNKLQRYDEALKEATEASGAAFQTYDFVAQNHLHLDKAVALSGLKRYEEALEEILIATKRNPHFRDAYLVGKDVALKVHDTRAAAEFEAQADANPFPEDRKTR